MSEQKFPLRIERAIVKNYKRVKGTVELDLRGKSIIITGHNGEGKTSLIDALVSLTQTRNKKLTPDKAPALVHNGAKGGSVTWELTDGTRIESSISAKTNSIKWELFDADGVPQDAPRTLIDNLVGVVNFDVNAFLNMTEGEAVNFIKEITGLDFTDLDQEEKIATAERLKTGQALEVQDQILLALGTYDKEKIVAKSIDEVTAKRLQTEEAIKKYEGYEEAHAERVVRTENFADEIACLAEEIQVARRVLESLEKKHTDRFVQNNTDKDILAKGKLWFEKNPKPELGNIEQEVKEVYEWNEAVKNNLELDKQGALCKELAKTHEQAKERVENVRISKKTRIAEAKFPVQGMSFDPTGKSLLLDGIPFTSSQINTAKKIVAGIQMQIPLMKKLGVVRFDASQLDPFTLDEVKAWCFDQGLQMFIEDVEKDRDKKGIAYELVEEIEQE